MKLSEMTKHEGGRYHDGERFLPWYTSPCLEWLMTLDLLGKNIWEYGVGDSSAWYRSRGCKVHGVESDKIWADKCGVFHETDEEFYLGSIHTIHGFYDIIIIDGLFRDKCSEFALPHLKPGGYLVIDNWKQETVEPIWDETEKLIHGMEQTLYLEPNHWDKWATLVVKKPL